jgi:hypothetical protein
MIFPGDRDEDLGFVLAQHLTEATGKTQPPFVVDYLYRTFLRISADLKKANELLEIRIAARTAELSNEVAERKRYGGERDKVIGELQEAMAQINTLTGLLPTCASCKKIRDAEGTWVEMESYIQDNSTARFSHGICPSCAKKLYPDIYPKLFQSPGQTLPTKP